jgi:GTPase SAR1 family protein
MSRNSDIEEGKQNSYKTIVIGNSDVGKSTLLVQFIDGKFSRQIATVGLDYHSKKV